MGEQGQTRGPPSPARNMLQLFWHVDGKTVRAYARRFIQTQWEVSLYVRSMLCMFVVLAVRLFSERSLFLDAPFLFGHSLRTLPHLDTRSPEPVIGSWGPTRSESRRN
jgi:hypothetical protein